jgi:DNA repair ATPase RecN
LKRWYAANRMQLYMHLDQQLRCAIEDTCRESWMESSRVSLAESASLRTQLVTAQQSFADLREADAESLLEALTSLGETINQKQELEAQLSEMTALAAARLDTIKGLEDSDKTLRKDLEIAVADVVELREALEKANGIIEQYPVMVRNLISRKPVTNVPHLTCAAEKWLKEYAALAKQEVSRSSHPRRP